MNNSQTNARGVDSRSGPLFIPPLDGEGSPVGIQHNRWAGKKTPAHPTRLTAFRRQHSGAVLIVSLIFLLVMTALGVTSVQVTSLEEKMVGNTRERSVAFQAAESALKEGEALIENPATLATLTFPTTVGGASTQAGIYRSDSAAPSLSTCASPCSLQQAYLLDEFWTNGANYRTYMDTNNDGVADVDKNGDGTPDVNVFGVANTPKYVIEKLIEAPTPPLTGNYYRITAWGVGGTADSVVIVQSTYLK